MQEKAKQYLGYVKRIEIEDALLLFYLKLLEVTYSEEKYFVLSAQVSSIFFSLFLFFIIFFIFVQNGMHVWCGCEIIIIKNIIEIIFHFGVDYFSTKNTLTFF